MEKKLNFLKPGQVKYKGFVNDNVEFVTEKQLLDKELWDKCVNVFITREDSGDGGWRGEFWGKMMRGAALTYQYSKNEKLYKVLTYAVEGLLKTQDEFGRFSTYQVKDEFHGWDMWGRKYVLTGMQHYYRICKDEDLKNRIVVALSKHVDYIISKIGNEEGKVQITDTSEIWGNVNSCTILEPVVELYKMTNEKKYLDFAEYIVSTGGSKDCNLIDLAEEGTLMPYQYPVTKAYEMMSFYEGVLAYSEVTNDKRLFDVVVKFVEAVNSSDITIIGSAGCTHELFDNSAITQTNEVDNIMQETCVTVTWIRILSRLIALTENPDYADRIEKSTYNALYGALNFYGRKQYSIRSDGSGGDYLYGMVFDSYSPLVNNIRGRGIGGFKEFKDGGYHGCCASIGSAGTALFPLTAVMKSEDGLVFNNYIDGKIKYTTDNGTKVSVKISTGYPVSGKVLIKIKYSKPEKGSIKLRVPSWCGEATITFNGINQKVEKGYCVIDSEFSKKNEIYIDMGMEVKIHTLNGKTAYTYGALVLATDGAKCKCKPCERELFRTLLLKDGKELLLTDYASCGKDWNEDADKIKIHWTPEHGWRICPSDELPRVSVWQD